MAPSSSPTTSWRGSTPCECDSRDDHDMALSVAARRELMAAILANVFTYTSVSLGPRHVRFSLLCCCSSWLPGSDSVKDVKFVREFRREPAEPCNVLGTLERRLSVDAALMGLLAGQGHRVRRPHSSPLQRSCIPSFKTALNSTRTASVKCSISAAGWLSIPGCAGLVLGEVTGRPM